MNYKYQVTRLINRILKQVNPLNKAYTYKLRANIFQLLDNLREQ